MDPRTDYSAGETATTRAFIELFRRVGGEFQFAVDSTVEDNEEVRGYLITDDVDYDTTTIGVTAINEKERFETIKETIEEMGLTMLEEGESEENHEAIGDYTAYTLLATAPENIDAEWNVPNLLVYGSLSPEVEEACHNAFGTSDRVHFDDIRNHFVVYGEGLTNESKTQLATAVQRSTEFFDNRQRDVVSSINTSDFI